MILAVIDIMAALQIVAAVVNVLLIVAIFRIFSIDATLKKILKAVEKADARRREEYESMASD